MRPTLRPSLALTVLSVVVLTVTAVVGPSPASGGRSGIHLYFAPGLVREGPRHVSLMLWNDAETTTCAPVTVTVNRVLPATIASFTGPEGWSTSLGNEARGVLDGGLAPDQSAVFRMWLDVDSIAPWRHMIYEAELLCGRTSIASARLDFTH